MFVLDVNVVVARFRADHPHHDRVRRWTDHLWDSADAFTVPITVWASFLRVTTNRRIFRVPADLDEAFGFVEAVRAQPGHLDLPPGPRHLEIVRRLCEDADARGDLVPDAVIAAHAVEHGAVVATLDRDFARFGAVQHELL